ncbi:hypothetical protein TRFO_41773 [Tritrichomonas foetus]|uniref:Myb-like DNA-binding domain containing protein n=1 Tax=Tritrichomonas foetus TaxID=1144522 RepID=A0A1J4L046_9EUKA|nr:hypothetical protein TRFO_41773 [Tritrichomonas foetus]|eukprot:OHT16504.1 hypothetical protein TRFO_41773 [Tritrichomonas foetus]
MKRSCNLSQLIGLLTQTLYSQNSPSFSTQSGLSSSQNCEECGSRKKTRTWTNTEDQKLLAGIARYGLDNWQMVAKFLGGGRNKAQCSQRWARCLNPKISKKGWTSEDDKKLKELVELHGEKNWTKIASIFGNRSDVQCRYHYRQLMSASGNTNNNTDNENTRKINENNSNPNHRTNRELTTEFKLDISSLNNLTKKTINSALFSENIIFNGDQLTTNTPSSSPINSNSFLTSKLPTPMISSIAPGQSAPCPSSTTARPRVLSPEINKIKDLMPLMMPLAPITPSLRHAREQALSLIAAENSLNYRTTQSLHVWGVCGIEQDRLSGFLRQL